MGNPLGKETWIEELVDRVPESVSYLIGRGMRPIACGEPVWETIEGLARSKGLGEEEIDQLLGQLNALRDAKETV